MVRAMSRGVPADLDSIPTSGAGRGDWGEPTRPPSVRRAMTQIYRI
ncbi:MAG: hypothetical protein AVDCRST_MAG70-1991 [uncultured Thermomicrobiales bacterium]|uniref:Uncharacterized protein n=1 Tax=uncultured Thermomicrobiales bacterium TaxID=1645740 RepID=A0A6J4UZT1_9BACT|nr:MAG: hypothetical protein AVDCRST_MAG70-1991 [uncultured Thermomicrobiales bacterium]